MFLNVVNLLSGTVAITVESGFPRTGAEPVLGSWLGLLGHGVAQPYLFSMKLSRKSYLRLRRLAKKLDCDISVEKKTGVPFLWPLSAPLFSAGRTDPVSGIAVYWIFLRLGFLRSRAMRRFPMNVFCGAGERGGALRHFLGLAFIGNAENHILMEIPELSWMTVNVNGFRATVIVRERTPVPERATNTRRQCGGEKRTVW